MMRFTPFLAALSLALLTAASPADAAEPPAGTVKVKNALLHEATGILLPQWLKGLRRNLSRGEALVAIYTPSSPYRSIGDLNIGVAIGPLAEVPDRAKLRQAAWDELSRLATPQVIYESNFSWPGHPDAVTSYGAYFVGRYRKTYWRAYDNGWDVLVTLTTLRDREAQMRELSDLVAREIFGGALIAPTIARP